MRRFSRSASTPCKKLVVTEHQAPFVWPVDKSGMEAITLDPFVETWIQRTSGRRAPKDRNEPPEKGRLEEGVHVHHPDPCLAIHRDQLNIAWHTAHFDLAKKPLRLI